MQTLFSTDGVQPQDRFRQWREVCEDRLVPMTQSCLGDEPFRATIDGVGVGDLVFTRFRLDNLRASTTPRTIRHPNNKTGQLFLSLVLSGSVRAIQNDRSATDSAGDFSIRDPNTPWALEHRGHTDVLAIAIPLDRLEGMLGSARHFAGLTMSGQSPVAILARSFLSNMMHHADRLTAQAAERMTAVAIDLVAASLAERMAMDTPKALSGTLTVQRAKAYAAANLGNPGLDASQVAVAVGVSMRRLQTLFRDRGPNVTAWIWQQRLEKAARRLSDPGCLHVQLGELAYGCGFASQSHFSRRFRHRYGLTPSDYRHTALARCAGTEGAAPIVSSM